MSDTFQLTDDPTAHLDDDHFVKLGETVDLYTRNPALNEIVIGAGWDANTFGQEEIDADLSLIILNKDNMTKEDQDFIFYNNVEAYGGAIVHNYDSRSGAGEGDDESININLQGIPFDRLQILIIISIYKGYEKQQSLGQLKNLYIRLVDAATTHEIARYKMDEDTKGHEETAVIAGILERNGPTWNFIAHNDFEMQGMRPMAMRYGLTIMNQ